MASRLREEARTMFNRPALGIAGGPVETPQAREGNRRGAHRAGLERHIEIASGEPFGVQRPAGGANRKQFGVRGRITVAQGAIAGARHDRALPDDDGADRHFASLHGGASFEKSKGKGIAPILGQSLRVRRTTSLPYFYVAKAFRRAPGAVEL